uniref:Nudix hydrolase domain-containing protein n=1 Tax=Panagrolaimus sp. ES5 TaxID=591445 RepID=A0AC34F963_9BILA
MEENQLAEGSKRRRQRGKRKSSRTSESKPAPDFTDIPEQILADICERFVISLPDDLKEDNIRICFEIELAFWFFLDNYNDSSVCNVNNKQHREDFKNFAKVIFKYVDYLRPRLVEFDKIMTDFVDYKKSIPVKGAILLDKSLNYVLLVQGYYASKGSWGFPKGKVNEDESDVDCAIREVREETSYDISDKINSHCYISRVVGKTPTQLFIVKDVEIDFLFKPEAPYEIRRIQWFSVWDLPLHQTDREACARFDLKPTNFFTIATFIKQLQKFVRSEQNRAPKTSNINIGQRSAFMPVVPRKSLPPTSSSSTTVPEVSQKVENPSSPSPMEALTINTASSPSSSTEAVFKPLHLNSQASPLTKQSFTGESFLKMITSMQSPQPPPPPPLEPEIIHPKPIHPSKLVILVYEVPDEEYSAREGESSASNDNVSINEESEYETILKLNETAELAMSTSESVLKTPATEKKPLPGEECSSLHRGSEPYDPFAASSEEQNNQYFARTPKSSRSRRNRRNRKSQCSENDNILPFAEETSASDVILPENLLSHEQGINFNLSNVLECKTPNSVGTPSPPSLHQSPGRPLHAPVPTTLSYVPFSPPAGPVKMNAQVFSETSAFTPVKQLTSAKSSDQNIAAHNGSTDSAPKNGATQSQFQLTELSIPLAWQNFHIDTDRLVEEFKKHMEECLTSTMV